MIQIDNYIFSRDVLEKKFKCDLSLCHGNCCLEGDSGAPLTTEEAAVLEEIYPLIKKYLRPDGIGAIEKEAAYSIDKDGDFVTPLIDNRECAYTVYEGDILLCGIEKAWKDGVIDFQKPISCHLFPIRVKKFGEITGVNYQEVSACASARECGKMEGIAVYRFLREPIIRAFGQKIFDELCVAEQQLKEYK